MYESKWLWRCFGLFNVIEIWQQGALYLFAIKLVFLSKLWCFTAQVLIVEDRIFSNFLFLSLLTVIRITITRWRGVPFWSCWLTSRVEVKSFLSLEDKISFFTLTILEWGLIILILSKFWTSNHESFLVRILNSLIFFKFSFHFFEVWVRLLLVSLLFHQILHVYLFLNYCLHLNAADWRNLRKNLLVIFTPISYFNRIFSFTGLGSFIFTHNKYLRISFIQSNNAIDMTTFKIWKHMSLLKMILLYQWWSSLLTLYMFPHRFFCQDIHGWRWAIPIR